MDGAEFWFRVDDPKHVVWVRPVGSVSFCKARDCYDRALAVDPNHLKTLHNLGILHDEQGRPAEAQARYDQALAINSCFDALQRVGDLHVEHGRPAEAQDCYERALAINSPLCQDCGVKQPSLALPPSSTALWCVGCAKEHPGAASIKANDQALAVNISFDAFRRVGDLYVKHGRLAEAQHCYERALAIDPKHVLTLYSLGLLHVKQGRPAEAQAHVDTLCNLGDIAAQWTNQGPCGPRGLPDGWTNGRTPPLAIRGPQELFLGI